MRSILQPGALPGGTTRNSFALLLLLATTGCALFPRNITPPESVFSDAGLQARKAQDGDGASNAQLMALLESDVVSSWNALAKATPANEAELSNALLDKGISLVDARCDRYFLALGRAAQKVGFAQKELSLGAGLVSMLQGLTGVAARDIAITAGTFSFAGASSVAYTDAFIFSPEVSGVQALVAAAQAAAKERIEKIPLANLSRGAAINLLQDYEKTCEVHTIRRLVNESLVSARPVAAFGAEEQADLPLRLATQDALAPLLKVGQVSDDQLQALYWLTYKSAPVDAAEQGLLMRLLGRLPDLVDEAGKLKTDDASKAALRAVKVQLRGLVLISAARLDTELAAIRATVAVPKTASAPAPGPNAAPQPRNAGQTPEVAPSRKSFAPSLTIRVPSSGR